MKIKEYKVIEVSSGESLGEKVNEFIKEGWQPFGSPTFLDYSAYQAVVKYE